MIISSQVYPIDLVIAKCVPIWKNKGKPTDPTKYRKIALVGSIAKIIDKWLFSNQANLNIDKILPSNIYGYRKYLGTEDAIVDMREKVLELKAK